MVKRLVDMHGCNPMVHAHYDPLRVTNRVTNKELLKLKVFVDFEKAYFSLHTTE